MILAFDIGNTNIVIGLLEGTKILNSARIATDKKKTEIEGLGVESVQISYESWYTPTVTIKFVDLRGSALFGREEAIHVDEKFHEFFLPAFWK